MAKCKCPFSRPSMELQGRIHYTQYPYENIRGDEKEVANRVLSPIVNCSRDFKHDQYVFLFKFQNQYDRGIWVP